MRKLVFDLAQHCRTTPLRWLQILIIINENEESYAEEVSDTMSNDRTSTLRIMDKLETLGYLKSHLDSRRKAGRSTRIFSLTNKTKKMMI